MKTRIGSMKALVRLALPTLAILATVACPTTSGKAGLHGLIRDEHGRKMSKSYGNVIDRWK